jgi:hypothetical protein
MAHDRQYHRGLSYARGTHDNKVHAAKKLLTTGIPPGKLPKSWECPHLTAIAGCRLPLACKSAALAACFRLRKVIPRSRRASPDDADVHAEGKPSLHPDIHQPDFGVLIIMVEVGAFGGLHHQVHHFSLVIASDAKC